MSELTERLRAITVHSVRASMRHLGVKPIDRANATIQQAADALEDQEVLIKDLADCLEDMTKHYVEVRNDLYGLEAAEEWNRGWSAACYEIGPLD